MMHDDEEKGGNGRFLIVLVEASYLGKLHSVVSRVFLSFATKVRWGLERSGGVVLGKCIYVPC